jgi:hypothetical protein
VTLTELMIATAVISVAVLGMIGAFASIQQSVQTSKNKTLASNLAQEKLQILGQINYYQLLVTPTPQTVAGTSPTIVYDNTYFPPETILQGGVTFTRYTYVQQVTITTGAVVALPPSTPDTGLRLVTVGVTWTIGGQARQMTLTSVISNPNTAETNSTMSGNVKDLESGANINNALVNVAENLGWRAYTNLAGNYSINTAPGSYNMDVYAVGYFPAHVLVSVIGDENQVTNFTLEEMSSGTVTGTVWMNPSPVVSEVVASTTQLQLNGMVVQYVELFNPTTSYWAVGQNGSNPSLLLNYQTASGCGGNNDACYESGTNHYGIKLVYTSTQIAPNGYYVIANTTTFMINGATITADAVYDPNANTFCEISPNAAYWNTGANPPLMQILDIGHGGAVWLSDASGNVLNSVGWKHNANAPSPSATYCGGSAAACIPDVGGSGFVDDTQFVRISSPNFVSEAVGRAYDFGVSTIDFVYPTVVGPFMTYTPFSSASSTQPVVAGVPAIGAVVTSNDGLSNGGVAVSSGSVPYAYFNLVNVATATAAAPWTVLVTSGVYTVANTSVTIAATGSVYAFPSTTSFLNQANVQGFVSGTVTDAFGVPISGPAITVSGSGNSTLASVSNGNYTLQVSSGLIDIFANSTSPNTNYVAISSLAVPVSLGQIHSGVNFQLSLGGQISGWITRDGVNPLPGVTVAALDINGFAHDVEVSNASGHFTTIIMSTGIYTIQPEMDSLETSSPTSVNTNMSSSGVFFSSSFTVTGALGYVSGSVTAGGKPIPTGVTIIVTTTTLAGSPPVMPIVSSATAASPYYGTSSLENGTYSIGVRQSTSPAYNIYAWYPSVGLNGTVTIQWSELTAVPVTAGGSVPGENFAW